MGIPESDLPCYEIGPTSRARKIRKHSASAAMVAVATAETTLSPDTSLTPWQALGHNSALLRAIEVALTGTHSLRIVGHPENGRAEWLALLAMPEMVSYIDERIWRLASKTRLDFEPAGVWLGPASWQSPCACGYLTDPGHECTCSPLLVDRYSRRLRAIPIDIDVEAPRPQERGLRSRDALARLEHKHGTDAFCEMLARVEAARAILLSTTGLSAPLDSAAQSILAAANEKLALTLDGRGRVLSVARTCAALAGRDTIRATDIAETLTYRRDYR